MLNSLLAEALTQKQYSQDFPNLATSTTPSPPCQATAPAPSFVALRCTLSFPIYRPRRSTTSIRALL